PANFFEQLFTQLLLQRGRSVSDLRILANRGPALDASGEDDPATRDGFDSLTPQQRQSFIATLSDSELHRLLGTLTSGATFSERTDFFNTLATSLSGSQLARISHALEPPVRAALASSVERFSPAAVASDFGRWREPLH